MKKIVFGAVIIGMFCAVATVHASMLDDIRGMLGQSRLAAKQDVGEVLGASTSVMATLNTKMLTIGLKNDPDVRKIQASLNQLGFLTITPDGNYGPQTAAAVTKFQAINGLDATGVVDPETKMLINQGSLPTLTPVVATSTDTSLDVLQKNIEQYTAVLNSSSTPKTSYVATPGKVQLLVDTTIPTSVKLAHSVACIDDANGNAQLYVVTGDGVWHHLTGGGTPPAGQNCAHSYAVTSGWAVNLSNFWVLFP